MKREYCNKVANHINSKYQGLLYAVVHKKRPPANGFYVWVYRENSKDLVMVVHGERNNRYSKSENPYEILLINLGDGTKTLYESFSSFVKLYKYLINESVDVIAIHDL